MRLKEKRALVTGATSGMGRAVVTRFVAEGARVVFCGRNVEAGKALAEEIGPSGVFVRADVTDERDVTSLVDRAVDLLGGIDCLFNNAAEASPSPFLAAGRDELSSSMWSVFGSVVLVTQQVARHMIEARGGVILQNGSSAAYRGNSSPAIYSALKAAVCHLTRCLAMELAPYAVRVNTISPGAIVTPIFQSLFQLDGLDRDDAMHRIEAVMAAANPSRRAGMPSDIAAAAVFLASDEASYITGHDLVVDGGLTAGLTPQLRAAQDGMIKTMLTSLGGT